LESIIGEVTLREISSLGCQDGAHNFFFGGILTSSLICQFCGCNTCFERCGEILKANPSTRSSKCLT